MTLKLQLKPDLEARLHAAAQREGVEVAEMAERTLAEHLPPLSPEIDAENAALIALLESWRKEDAAGDPEELAAQGREWDEMQANLEANRLSLPVPDLG